MSIQDLGAIGELLGSLFVLITLIYLAVQVRHSRDLLEENRKLALSAAYQSRTGFRMDLAKDSMNDSWVALQRKLRNEHHQEPIDVQMKKFDTLSVEEKIKIMYWQETVAHSVDNALFQIELGFSDKHVEQTATSTILAHYPFWTHTGSLIPPRVAEWYKSNGPQG